VFEKSDDGEWAQAAKLVAADAKSPDNFGSSVSVSDSTIVVGVQRDDDAGSYTGSAYVFEKNATGAWAQAAKLVAADAAKNAYFGSSVSVSGSTIVVGAYRAINDASSGAGSAYGSAYVFEKSDDGEWAQAAKLVDAESENTQFGKSVSVSGSTIVVGLPRDHDLDGRTVYNTGSAYVFEKSDDGEWAQAAKLVDADGAKNDYFGSSVSVSDSTIVVGATGDDDDGANSGSAYVFEKSDDGEWAQAAKLVAADAANGDEFGWSVSVSDSTIVVGALRDDDDAGSNTGSAYVFEKNATGAWAQAAKLANVYPSAGDSFGWSVSVSGSTIVVGPQYDDVDAGVKAGSATVFDSNPGSTASGDDSDADAASPASVSATFHNILDGYKFTTTITKTSDGTYNVTAEQENATMSGAFLGAKLGAAAAAAMSSPARAAAPVLALAAVAAAAGVAMNRSRRASRVSDEDAPLLKGAQYGAASV